MRHLLVFCCLCIFTSRLWGSDDGFPILQGVTTAKTAQFSILLQADQDLEVEALAGKSRYQAKKQIRPSLDGKWVIQHFAFTDLQPGTYKLVGRSKNKEVFRRSFQTLNTKARQGRIAVASCSDDAYHDVRKGIWKTLLAQKPDLIFLIGDNVYGDARNGLPLAEVSPKVLWERYIEAWQTYDLFKAETLVPVVAVWDDHDFGANNGNKDFRWKYESQEIFRTFFAQEDSGELFENGPGVSSILTAFGNRFVFLDNRSFRDGGEDGKHFGSEQEQWLFEQLNGQSMPTWLISGDQFFGAYHQWESFQGNHPNDFEAFTKKLAAAKSRVVLISGDRHLFEMMKISKDILGYQTYEITTSGIHSKMYPSSWGKQPNPLQILGVANEANFAVFDIKNEPTHQFSVQAMGVGGKVLAKKSSLKVE